MAKRKSTAQRDPDEVYVMARAGFKHRGVFIRTGECCYMDRAEALDMKALHMIEPLEDLRAEKSDARS